MNWRHRTPEPDPAPLPEPDAPSYVEVALARRLLEEQMLRGRNKADRQRARNLYMDLIAGAA